MFREQLYLLAPDRWLAITLDDSLEHSPPPREIEWARAMLQEPGGSSRDLTAFVSLPLAAADGRQSLQMPRWLFPLEGMRVLCAYHSHLAPVLFRCVDLETGHELRRFDGAAVHAAVSMTRSIDDAAERAQADWFAGRTFSPDLLGALNLRPLAASRDRLLVASEFGRALVDWSGGRLRHVRSWASMVGAFPAAARTARGFVFHCEGAFDAPAIIRHVRGEDGEELGAWPLQGEVVKAIAGEQPPGANVLIATDEGPLRHWSTAEPAPGEVFEMTTIPEDGRVEMALGPDGANFAVRFGDDGNELVVAQARSFGSRVVGLPRPRSDDPEANAALPVPGFAVGDDEVLLLRLGQLVRHRIGDLPWQ